MISCIEWIPKGIADPTPKKYEFSPAELELIEKQAEMEKEIALQQQKQENNDNDDESNDENDNDKTTTELPKIENHNLPPELRMDEYDDDDDDDDPVSRGIALGNMLVGNNSELLDVPDKEEEDDDEDMEEEKDDNNNDDDSSDSDDDKSDNDDDRKKKDTREYMPLDIAGLAAMGISHGDYDDDDDEDDEDSDLEDINLNPDDAIVVVAKTDKDDFASLEVHVYEEKTGNLFIHHDIPLPSFPLCLAQGDISSDGTAGNYMAVGTFSPGIELWNLDVMNALEPTCILGGDAEDSDTIDEIMKRNMNLSSSSKKKKKKKKKQQLFDKGTGPHTDAVMSLSWNKIHRQVIASGSADHTVKIWDVTSPSKAESTFTHHSNKVQSVVWHPSEGTLLATGAYDHSIALLDARVSTVGQEKKVKITSDIESMAWDPHQSQYLTAATEDGTLSCWDVRNFTKPVWSFVVEEYGGVTDLSYNPTVPGMLATCSINKTVTLWDAQNHASKPVACGNKSMEVGKLYTLSFYTSSPWLLGCGGSDNRIALWDMTREDAIQKRFGNRLLSGQQQEQQEENTKEEDFEAKMIQTDAALEKARTNATAKQQSNKKKNKQRGKNKGKGAHKRRR